MDVLSTLLSVMSVFAEMPALAFVPGAGFLVVGRRMGSSPAVVIGACWALYGLYEGAIYLDLLCRGECNIRADLVLLYPALVIGSLVGLVSIGSAHLGSTGSPEA